MMGWEEVAMGADDEEPRDHYAVRRARTEARIVAAATALFLRDGYAATALTDVARSAKVSERTIYLHFASKVALFQRVIEVGIVGDVDPVPMPERDWSRQALTAPTVEGRIDAFADGVSDMHERLGPLMAVNAEVENSEEIVRESAGAWRAATLDYLRTFWGAMVRDGHLPDDTDVEWLAATTAILSAAESRLLVTRTLDWDRDRYRTWLVRTWLALLPR